MLLALLHLCDSLFPLGGFAHSDGLEAATASGRISSPDDLGDWMDVCLHETLSHVDGPAVLMAWRAARERREEDLDALDAEVHALRPSSTARSASRAMGTRLLKTWQKIYGAEDRVVVAVRPATLPVAFGIVCAGAGIESRAAVEAFIYTRLAATVSSAMRLVPIGQHEAHALLAAALARAPAAADRIERSVSRGQALGAFAPAFDLAMMEQQYVGSRLFLS